MQAAIRLLYDHLVPVSTIGVACAYYFGDWKLFGIALLTGWLIDADHLADFSYFIWHKKKYNALTPYELTTQPILLDTLTDYLKLFISGRYFLANNKVFVPLHSWELAFIWAVCWITIDNTAIAATGTLAWLTHLVQDQFGNRVIPSGYFILYRIQRQFSQTGFCRK